jgi:hypothetical protein
MACGYAAVVCDCYYLLVVWSYKRWKERQVQPLMCRNPSMAGFKVVVGNVADFRDDV